MTIKAIRYLGHSSVFLEGTDLVVAIDPWLQGNPRCPDQFQNPAKLDLIALTHGHADHAGDALRLQQLTGASIAATYELAMIFAGLGVPQEKLLPMNKGGSANFGTYRISLTQALHSSAFDTENGPVYAGEPCGVVINDGQRSIFHAGDTALFSDLALIGKRYKPEIALLPIGDFFTMGQEEAAEAAKLLGVKVALPIHYKTSPRLEQYANQFITCCQSFGIKALEIAPGEALNLT